MVFQHFTTLIKTLHLISMECRPERLDHSDFDPTLLILFFSLHRGLAPRPLPQLIASPGEALSLPEEIFFLL